MRDKQTIIYLVIMFLGVAISIGALITFTGCTTTIGEEVAFFGEACEVTEDCDDGLLCHSEWANGTPVEGGICTTECEWTTEEEPEGTCDDKQVCLRYRPTDQKHCYEECYSEEDECREGWECYCVSGFDCFLEANTRVFACIPSTTTINPYKWYDTYKGDKL